VFDQHLATTRFSIPRRPALECGSRVLVTTMIPQIPLMVATAIAFALAAIPVDVWGHTRALAIVVTQSINGGILSCRTHGALST
jgi:hypothetical protein